MECSIKVVKYWGRQFGHIRLLQGTCSPSRNSSPKNDQMIWTAVHIYCTSPYSVCQGPPTILFESYCPADFSSNTTACNHQVTLITSFSCVWLGLEQKFCRTRVLQEPPCCMSTPDSFCLICFSFSETYSEQYNFPLGEVSMGLNYPNRLRMLRNNSSSYHFLCLLYLTQNLACLQGQLNTQLKETFDVGICGMTSKRKLMLWF